MNSLLIGGISISPWVDPRDFVAPSMESLSNPSAFVEPSTIPSYPVPGNHGGKILTNAYFDVEVSNILWSPDQTRYISCIVQIYV